MGIWRDFHDRFNFKNHNYPGASIGAGAFVPLIPDMLDFQGTAIYGQGGRNRRSCEVYLNGAPFGYGNPAYSNTGCFSETAPGSCVGNTREVQQIAAGAWDNVCAGGFGQLRIGVQYSYTKRTAFAGVGGAPAPDESMFFTSFRYYPF